jgi:hypothetical protein
VPRRRDRCPLDVSAEVQTLRTAANCPYSSLTTSSSLTATTSRSHRSATQSYRDRDRSSPGEGPSHQTAQSASDNRRLPDLPASSTQRCHRANSASIERSAHLRGVAPPTSPLCHQAVSDRAAPVPFHGFMSPSRYSDHFAASDSTASPKRGDASVRDRPALRRAARPGNPPSRKACNRLLDYAFCACFRLQHEVDGGSEESHTVRFGERSGAFDGLRGRALQLSRAPRPPRRNRLLKDARKRASQPAQRARDSERSIRNGG